MSEGKKYYCFCSSNCKYETMTKEQILSAIEQAERGEPVIDPDAGVLTKVKETNNGGYITFWVGTQAQYNALQGNVVQNCLYIITDETTTADMGKAISAMNDRISYMAERIGVHHEWLDIDYFQSAEIKKVALGATVSFLPQSMMWFQYCKAVRMVHFRATLYIDGSMNSGGTVIIGLPKGAYLRVAETGKSVLSCYSENADYGQFVAAIHESDRIMLRSVEGFSSGAIVTLEGWYPCIGEVVK